MKRARIRFENEIHAVQVEADNAVRLDDGRLLAEDQVEWLPPATGNMFALGLNYADHAAELAFTPPTEPLAFIKSVGTYTGHRHVTWRPDNVAYMHYECELVARDQVANPNQLSLKLFVNGELRQESSTADWVRDIP